MVIGEYVWYDIIRQLDKLGLFCSAGSNEIFQVSKNRPVRIPLQPLLS